VDGASSIEKDGQTVFQRILFLNFVAALSAASMGAVPAKGAECIGVQFPDNVKVADNDLVLNGLGIRKATIFSVKVYVSGLYLSEKSGNDEQILAANLPWQQVLHFVHDVDASDIRDAFDDGFKKAAGENFDALRKRIDALKTQMIDFKTGHVLSYAYAPNVGTVIDVNGKTRTIEGADFAAALLTISIGPEPPNEDLKSGLLGGKCD
jgi:hypothetical protein